jgi:hypothetical protein
MRYFDSINCAAFGNSSPAYGPDISGSSSCNMEADSDDVLQIPIPGWENVWIDLGGEG